MIVYVTQKIIRDTHGQSLDGLEQNYIEYFKHVLFSKDTTFIPVVNDQEAVKALTKAYKPDYIIITGGNDIDPKDAVFDKDNMDTDQLDIVPKRDCVERYLIQYADENHIRKLGICRGFQYLNVYYGGSIQYHLKDHASNQAHLCKYQLKPYKINSFHDHGIYESNLAASLKPIVYSEPDKVIEAYHHIDPNIPTLGVQWHPERNQPQDFDLFKLIWDSFNEGHYTRSR